MAIDAPHHVSKGVIDPGNANRGRGASAFKDAARLVYTLSKMTQEEAKTSASTRAIDGAMCRSIRPRSTSRPQRRRRRGSGLSACRSAMEMSPTHPATKFRPSSRGRRLTRWPWWMTKTSATRSSPRSGAPHALYTAHANSGQRHVGQVFQRYLPDITKKQAGRIITAWLDKGLLGYVAFKDNKSRERQGLGVCQ